MIGMKALSTAVMFFLLAAAVPAAEPERWHPSIAPVMTRWAAEVSPTNVLPEYPRPQLVRSDWLNLNGLWDYAITPDSEVAAPAFSNFLTLVLFS